MAGQRKRKRVLVPRIRCESRGRAGRFAANGVDIAHLMGMQAAQTMETCESLAAVCVDAAATVFDDGDFYDVVHHTPSGAEKVGLVMYESLQEYF